MAKKLNQINKPVTEAPRRYFRIQSKFARDVLCPRNAIERDFWEHPGVIMRLSTLDDVNCTGLIYRTVDNRDGYADESLDDFCQEKYGVSFMDLKQIWRNRLGEVDYIWHFIRLVKE